MGMFIAYDPNKAGLLFQLLEKWDENAFVQKVYEFLPDILEKSLTLTYDGKERPDGMWTNTSLWQERVVNIISGINEFRKEYSDNTYGSLPPLTHLVPNDYMTLS
jgi:hypothetical protein